MRIVILGAGSALCVPRYSPAGIYVRAGREHILFDAGAGTLQRLHRLGITFFQLDRLFLTHLHPDHCLDLVSLLFAMRTPNPPRMRPFYLYGAKGTKQLYRQLNTAFQRWIEPRTFRFLIKEIGQTRIRLPGYVVRTKRMIHSTGSLAYRLDARGKSVAYSGDTDVCSNIVDLGRNADLLILECSMTDERKVAGHLTPTECGLIASQAQCRHLVLTHFYPVFGGYDIRRRVRRNYKGVLTLAKDFTDIRI